MGQVIINIQANSVGPDTDVQQLVATLKSIIEGLTGQEPSVNLNDNNSLSTIDTAMINSKIQNRRF